MAIEITGWLSMSHATIYLKTLFSPTGLFKTQKDLAEKAGINPSTLSAALKKLSRLETPTLEKILHVLPPAKQDDLIAETIRDFLPEAYWSKVLAENKVTRLHVKCRELSGSVESLFNVLRIKALTKKRAREMLETAAEMLGIGRADMCN